MAGTMGWLCSIIHAKNDRIAAASFVMRIHPSKTITLAFDCGNAEEDLVAQNRTVERSKRDGVVIQRTALEEEAWVPR